MDILRVDQSFGRDKFPGGGDRDSKRAQLELAGRGRYVGKFDRAGVGILHRFARGVLLQVTSVSSGSIEIGAQISGPGIAAGAQIVVQLGGTPGGVGMYTLYAPAGTISSETMTESYGVLTVGSVTSGTVADGRTGHRRWRSSLTAIDGNLSGSGAGSTWIVNNAQTVAPETMTITATPLSVTYKSVTGATANRAYFEVSANGDSVSI